MSRGPALVLVLLTLTGCTLKPRPAEETRAPEPWSIAAAELLTWSAADPDFAQDRALEASGLTGDGRYLYAVAEKYATVIRIDPTRGFAADTASLDLPQGAELEGVTLTGDRLLMCDEAHAAVYVVDLAPGEALPERLPVRTLSLEGLLVEGGKTGLEGIAASADGQRIYLLHERSRQGLSCQAEIYPLTLAGDSLTADGPPVIIPLDDCRWRMAGLAMDDDRLVAIRSRYPGEEYHIVAIDPASGTREVLLDITELGRSLRGRGWGNNLEGLVIGPDGALFLISDNADTPMAVTSKPPPAEERTALIRLPRAGG